MKQIRRVIQVPCPDCWGTGTAVGGDCDKCKGRGEVDRVVVEIVHDNETARAKGAA